jgi:hypothetical protein
VIEKGVYIRGNADTCNHNRNTRHTYNSSCYFTTLSVCTIQLKL